MLKRIYMSPLGYLISLIMNAVSFLQQPFMVYGFYNRVQKKFMKNTRISSSTKFISKHNLDIGDNVWIGHFCVIDASNKIKIGTGVQTGSHVSIYTHSSHISVRLLGKSYLSSDKRVGYVKGSVSIGDFAFIGDSTIVFSGVSIGKGCLIKAGSIVTRSMPEFSVVAGIPAKVVGSVLDIDDKYLTDPSVKESYFAPEIIANKSCGNLGNYEK